MNSDEKIDKIYDVVIRMEPMVTEHHKTLYGNGKPGLRMDVDRLKIFKKVSCWFTSAFTLMILGVIGRFIYQVMTK